MVGVLAFSPDLSQILSAERVKLEGLTVLATFWSLCLVSAFPSSYQGGGCEGLRGRRHSPHVSEPAGNPGVRGAPASCLLSPVTLR